MPREAYQFTPHQISVVRRMWKDGQTQHAVCAAIGVTRFQFDYSRKHGVFRTLKKRPLGGAGVKATKNYRPSKKQIEATCKKIRDSWTGTESKERWIGRPFGGPIE